MSPEKWQPTEEGQSVLEDAEKVSGINGKPVDILPEKESKGVLVPGDFGRRARGSPTVEHVENVESPQAKLTRKQKAKRHCRRFWCCYLIAAIVFLAIFLPLFFLKVVPAIAQDIVNKTPLPIYGGAIAAYSPTELQISLRSALSIPSGLTVNLDPIQLYLFNENTTIFSPYTVVDIGAMTIKGDTPIDINDQVVTVTNETELVSFLNNVFASKQTSLSARGNTTAHLGALKAHVELDKTIEINALNNLDGFGLTDPKLVMPADADGTNIIGNLTLPNWSNLTLGMGNVTLNVFSGDLIIGNVSILNVVVPPGNNTLPFRGQIFLPTVLGNLGTVLTSQADALKDGNIAIGASGNSTIINGQHIPYLESVLNTKHLTAEIPIVQLLTDVLGSLLNGNVSVSGLLTTLEQALNSSGLLSELEPFLSGLNLTMADEIYRREVLGEKI